MYFVTLSVHLDIWFYEKQSWTGKMLAAIT